MLCNKEDSWEHVTLCDNNKKMRDDWIESVKLKFKLIDRKRNVTEYEKNISDEIENDIEKYVNDERNFHANQQVLGMR